MIKNWKYNLLSSFEYKKSFFTQIIFMIINNAFFLIYWLTVFNVNNNEINGFAFKDILYLWSISPISYGIANLLFGGLDELNRYIINGELDTFFLQPKNIFLNVATSKCKISALGDLIYGIAVACFAISNFYELILFCFFVIIGTVMFICTKTIIMMLGIWIGDVENMFSIYENSLLLTFSSYPESIFKNWCRVLMYTVVPAAYIVHIPISLTKAFDVRWLLVTLIAVVLYVVATRSIFISGLKKYESGNSAALKS